MPLPTVDRAVPAGREALGIATLRRCAPVPRGETGPWLLNGSAAEGDAVWFEVGDAESGDVLGHAVLVRREERRPAADIGYAPFVPTDPAQLEAALGLIASEGFGPLGLVRLDTRVRPGDDDAARALDRVGFVFVGYDRRGRHVWSVIPHLVR